MAEPLLTTKLLLPAPRTEIVARRHLVEYLYRSLSCKLTLISAPAGFGKTTLVGDWIEQRNLSAAWLTLDENDSDPVRFLSYFIKALQTIHPDFGATLLELLRSPQARINEPFLTAILNEVAASISAETVFVLDDYHLAESARLNEITAFFVKHAPPLLHTVIATRSDPALPVALLRGRGELLEIRQGDLRFTTEETGVFLNQMKHLQLTPAQVAALAARTEGWVSGLQMAVISMRGHEHVSDFIRSFTGSHRYIFDYLIEEVLDRQPKHIQEFLLRTAILARLNKDLCDALMNRTDSQAILDHLERDNLFIVPLDDDRYWYRYHQLFADLLRKQLEQRYPELTQELHQRASAWFEGAGYAEDAVDHALAARDYPAAVHILERSIPVMMGRGELSLVGKFIRLLPEEFVRSSPALAIQQTWGMALSGRLAEAEAKLLEIQALSENSREFAGHTALIRALIANMRGDMESAVSLAHRADERLPQDDVMVRGMIPYILGNGYLEIGNLDEAERACRQIQQFGESTQNVWTHTVAFHSLAQIMKLRGQLSAAKALCEKALQTAAERRAERYGFISGIYFELADILRESNLLDAARERVAAGLEISAPWGIPTDLVSGYITMGRVCIAQGDLEGAGDAVRKAKNAREMGHIFPIIQTKLDLCQVQLWLQQGNLSEPSHWAGKIEAELPGPDDDRQIDFVHELMFIGLARVWVAAGIQGQQPAALVKADDLLARLAIAARENRRFYRLMEILALQSIALDHLGDERGAFEALAESVSLAQPEGCMRIYLDEGRAMRSLLSRAQQHGIGLPYRQKLLHAFDAQEETLTEAPSPALPEPLSARELEVLQLLPTQMTATEMAGELIVAKSTLDTHIKHIYAKLGVNRRLEAIQRARELGLL